MLKIIEQIAFKLQKDIQINAPVRRYQKYKKRIQPENCDVWFSSALPFVPFSDSRNLMFKPTRCFVLLISSSTFSMDKLHAF